MIFLNNGIFNLIGLIDFIITILILGGLNFAFYKLLQRKFPRYFIILLSILFVIFTLFNLSSARILCGLILLVIIMVCLIANVAEFRTFIANENKSPKKIKTTTAVHEIDHVYDKEALYKSVNEAVQYLSKHKIGAIMTFERKDDLTKLLKNGSKLDAPVTYELLLTIFYPGTRLHDGAVVIRDNKIISASVYYSPTPKPLVGKYGSRHRAAIGISEICDAVTVVVSEETGRISIAYNGELESFGIESFYKAFTNIMGETERQTTNIQIIEGDDGNEKK